MSNNIEDHKWIDDGIALVGVFDDSVGIIPRSESLISFIFASDVIALAKHFGLTRKNLEDEDIK